MNDERFGQRLRELRQRASMSARELAGMVGVSSGFISQLERGKTSASLVTLRAVARALGEPLGALIDENDGAEPEVQNGEDHLPPRRKRHKPVTQVVRKGKRKRLELPGSHFKLELLSPDLQGQIEFIVIELEPGHPPSERQSHIRGGEECVVILQGRMGLTVGEESWVLEAGDSARFDPAVPHRIENLGEDTLVQISAITPPSF